MRAHAGQFFRQFVPRHVSPAGQLKLFFSELGDPADVARLAREQIEQHERRIAEYEQTQDRFGAIPAVAKRMVTLRLGLEMEHAALRFWRSLADDPLAADRASPAAEGAGGQAFLATPPTKP